MYRIAVAVFTVLFVAGGMTGAFALDLAAPFSHPDAPDADTVRGITFTGDILIVPLGDGKIKVWIPDGAGGGSWTALDGTAVFEDPANLFALTIFEESCPSLGVAPLDMITAHVPGLQVEQTVQELVGGTPLFNEAVREQNDDFRYITGLGSFGCMLIWTEKTKLRQSLVLQTAGGAVPLPLWDGGLGVLDGVVPEGESVRGIETTLEGSTTVLVIATGSGIYRMNFSQSGVSASSYPLNRPPAFTGDNLVTCEAGGGIVTLPVTGTDPDGDPVIVSLIDGPEGFSEGAIVHDCLTPMTLSWDFALTDGKLDPEDRPTRTYTIIVGEATQGVPKIRKFTPVPALGSAPLSVDFTYDVQPEGNEKLICQFDFDGDEFVDRTIFNCTQGTVNYVYFGPASYTAVLRVSTPDERAAQATATVVVD